MSIIKIVTIVGARPQFIKAAVVSRAIASHNQNFAKKSAQIDVKRLKQTDTRQKYQLGHLNFGELLAFIFNLRAHRV